MLYPIHHNRLTFRALIRACAAFFCLVSGSLLFAQPNAGKTSGADARIKFEHTTLSLGRIAAGSLVRREIVFTNEGDADLTITEISHSCSCTTTPEWTRVTPPRGEGRIVLSFHAMALSGEIKKTIAVHSNDPAQAVTTITLEGTVWQAIEFTPAVAVMKNVLGQSQELTTEIRIINHTEQPLTLQNPVSDHPQFRSRLETITAGKEFRLTVTAQPPFPSGILPAKITISASSAEIPILTVPAAVLTAAELTIHPPQLYLPLTAPATPAPHLISISSQSPQPITIYNASCDAPGSTVTIHETVAGKDFEIRVTFPQNLYSSPEKTYTIVAQTSAPSQPKISIPVSFARAPSFPPPSP